MPVGYVIKKRGEEFVLLHPSGREVARSHSKPLLESYAKEIDK